MVYMEIVLKVFSIVGEFYETNFEILDSLDHLSESIIAKY